MHENGAIIRCPGLFAGEIIVMVEDSRKSIVIAMLASSPDTEYVISVIQELIQGHFPQYILSATLSMSITRQIEDTGTKIEKLCSTCLCLSFVDFQLPSEQVGSIREGNSVSIMHS